jgi:hypothetical protein
MRKQVAEHGLKCRIAQAKGKQVECQEMQVVLQKM